MSPIEPKSKSSASKAPLTIREVAEHAGVSTATVSRVLSGQMVVSEELTDRVQAAVRELGYRPNRITRRHRKLPAQIVGLVLPDLESPYFNGMVAEITAVLEEASCSVVIYNSGQDPQREMLHLETLRAEGVAGIILVTTNSESDEMREYLRTGPPLVALDRKLEHAKTDSVRADYAALAQQAVEQLLAAGRRRIALLDDPEHVSAARERREGYLRALEAAQVEAPAKGMALVEPGAAAAEVKRLLALDPAPDAILAGSLRAAMEVLCALRETQIRVPEDLTVGCFEPLPGCLDAFVPLQIFAPQAGAGAAAARMLLERMARMRMPAREMIV